MLDAAEPLTGACTSPWGSPTRLARILAGERPIAALRAPPPRSPTAATSLALVARLEAAGLFEEAAEVHAAALAAERRPNGPMHADAALRRALLEHVRPEVADGEDGAVEAQLTVTSDPGALFRGWSLLASSAAAFADADGRGHRADALAAPPAEDRAQGLQALPGGPTPPLRSRSCSSASRSTATTSTPSIGASAGSSRA